MSESESQFTPSQSQGLRKLNIDSKDLFKDQKEVRSFDVARIATNKIEQMLGLSFTTSELNDIEAAITKSLERILEGRGEDKQIIGVVEEKNRVL